MKSKETHAYDFSIVESDKKIFKNITKYLSRIKLLPAPGKKNILRITDNNYAIAPSLTMVRLRGNHRPENAHIIVYGSIVPPHPGVSVQILFQGHPEEIETGACCQTKPLITMTDQAGGFTFDENFNCGPGVQHVTCVATLPGINAPDVTGVLNLKKKEKSLGKPHDMTASSNLPAISITIEFETNCHSHVTYYFNYPFKSGTVSKTCEITYRPTRRSNLYLKLSPYKEGYNGPIF
ncbi:MAG: hypothetical protein D3924_04700 [Candidatus Electrothrix sp. AR4]|nr:hypothetical protein [Candidatus Electrothrix sp. AR4]